MVRNRRVLSAVEQGEIVDVREVIESIDRIIEQRPAVVRGMLSAENLPADAYYLMGVASDDQVKDEYSLNLKKRRINLLTRKRFMRNDARLILKDSVNQTSSVAVSPLTSDEVFDDVMVCQINAKKLDDMHAMEAVLYKYASLTADSARSSSVCSSSSTRCGPSE